MEQKKIPFDLQVSAREDSLHIEERLEEYTYSQAPTFADDEEEFSKKMDNITLTNSTITFIIGGTLGLNKTILEKANESICFSKMTFPHQLIRLFLLEQIFRGFKISKGETYHR